MLKIMVAVKKVILLLLVTIKYSACISTEDNYLSKNKLVEKQSEISLTQLHKIILLNKLYIKSHEKNGLVASNYKNKYDQTILRSRYQSNLPSRIKRDEHGSNYVIRQDISYGSESHDSGNFISNLTGQITGNVAGLSSSASKGSSNSNGQRSPPTFYGPPVHHLYDQKEFSLWDFKRAILSTLIQAMKAISGSVLALKGQLIKGSGFLVSSNGRVISTTGNAVTGLGTKLASSAIVQPPLTTNPIYRHISYAYESPYADTNNPSYSESSPISGSYHTSFGSPTDVVYAYAHYP